MKFCVGIAEGHAVRSCPSAGADIVWTRVQNRAHRSSGGVFMLGNVNYTILLQKSIPHPKLLEINELQRLQNTEIG